MINDEMDLWGETSFSRLNKLNTPNMRYIPTNPWQFTSQQINDFATKYAELLDKYAVLSNDYKQSMIDQKQVLEKCIQYQNDIINLQNKYSKLQAEYIKLMQYVVGDDKDDEEINKIKII